MMNSYVRTDVVVLLGESSVGPPAERGRADRQTRESPLAALMYEVGSLQ